MLAQEVTTQFEVSGNVPGWFWPVYGVVIIVMIAAMWKVFTKAGKPGWAAIIPIYNFIVMLEIIGRPIWWLVLMFIPFVNFVVFIIIAVDMAKSFGRSAGYGIGLAFLPFIFYLMLGFGPATYQGPAAAAAGTPPPPPPPGGMTA